MRHDRNVVPPVMPRRALELTALIASMLWGASCGAGRATPVPAAIPPSVAPDSARTAVPRVTHLTNASHRYTIVVVSQSLEVGPNGRSDSVSTKNEFSVTLSALPTSDFLVSLVGPRVVVDSTLPREQRAKMDSVARILLEVDPEGQDMSVQAAARDSCQGEGTLLSPLIARLLTVPPAALREGVSPVSDSLEYTTCTGSTKLRTMSRLSLHPIAEGVIQVQIDGTVRADSTHALPMHLTGLFSGSATVTPDVTFTALADRVSFSMELHLQAASSLRRQQFTQRTWSTVERR